MAAIITTMLEFKEVIVPIGVHSAKEKRDVSLGRALDGKAIRQINVKDPGPEAEKLTLDPLIRGKKGEIAGNQWHGDVQRGVWDGDVFKEIKPDDLEQIEEVGSIESIAVNEFIFLKDIPWQRVNGTYYIVPQQGFSPKALVLIRDALAREKVAGVCKFVLRSRQRLGLLFAVNGGLVLVSIAYAGDFARAMSDMTLSHPDAVSKEAMEMARRVIQNNMVEADALDSYDDELIALKQKLVDAALAGEQVKAPEKGKAKTPTAADDSLMTALKASVAEIAAEKKVAKKKVPA